MKCCEIYFPTLELKNRALISFRVCKLIFYLPIINVGVGNHWSDIENRRQHFVSFAKEKGFDPLAAEQWRQYTYYDLCNFKVNFSDFIFTVMVLPYLTPENELRASTLCRKPTNSFKRRVPKCKLVRIVVKTNVRKGNNFFSTKLTTKNLKGITVPQAVTYALRWHRLGRILSNQVF